MGDGDTWINALIGAVVTVVTSFTGISPVIGGAVAGYLNRYDGVKVGALSGLIASIPLLALLFFAGSVFAFLPFAGPGMMNGSGALFGIAGFVIIVFAFFVALLYAVVLGALGGYIGQYLKQEDVL